MEEELLLLRKAEANKERWKEIGEEIKRVSKLAGPFVVVTLSQYLLQVVTLMTVGHFSTKLYLSSTALAVSLAAVTGYSFLVGMAGALETLSGQAYGAKQYTKIGTQTYTAIFSLAIFSIPLCILWINIEKILIFIGQDPSISYETGKFMKYLVPSLLSYAVFHPLVRYFQSQSIVIPMFISSCVTLCLHIPICWILVHKSGLENLGGAVAMDVSNWLNTIFLALYMRFSSACSATRSDFSMEIFYGVGVFFRYAIPSATMVCFEWWTFESLILLSGFLPNPELETSVLSVCLTTIGTLFSIPYGISFAGSTRVANELGAANPQGARKAAFAVVLMGVTNGLIVSSVLIASRKVLGYIFSNDKEVVDYVTLMAPFICANGILDSTQAVLSGIARGCGWQHIGSLVNLTAFYLVGIPMSLTLAFWMQLNGRGLWMGLLCGCVTQNTLLIIITSRTNWEQEARKARKRLEEESCRVINGAYADEQRSLLN